MSQLRTAPLTTCCKSRSLLPIERARSIPRRPHQTVPSQIAMVPLSPFFSWCESRGIVSPLQLQGIDSSYRYLSTSADLSAGSSILSIPLDTCLVANTKEELAEKLVHEKSLGSASEYAPYLQLLPPDVEAFRESFPRFWSNERRDLLFGFDGGQVERRIATDERKELDPWAYACVSSRSNFLSDYRYSITPLLDFLNHDANVGTSATIENDTLDLSTNRNWKAEEEVKISYGALSNIDTLCDYGFVMEDNPCNFEVLEIRLLGSPSVAVAVYPDGSVDNSAIYMLRENLATSEEAALAMSREGSPLMKFSKPISDRNELDVYSLLASSLDDAASTSASGAEEAQDDSLISTYLSGRAGTLRRGIKAILQKYPDLEY